MESKTDKANHVKKYLCDQEPLNPLCARLPESIRSQLCCKAREIKLERNAFVSVADHPNNVAIIRTGALAIEIPSENGSGFSSFIGGPGYLVNVIRISSARGNRVSSYNEHHRMMAIAPSTACRIPIDTINKLMDECPPLMRIALNQLTERLADVTDRLVQSEDLTSEDKIEWLLTKLKELDIAPHEVTHEIIARILGLNRVTVTRHMRTVLERI
ncbi:MAG: Crp/Fnr family transcriptional regulator [Gordonibacter sp.]